MSMLAALETTERANVLDRLRDVCDSRGLGGLSSRLGALAALVHPDMRLVDADLADLPRGRTAVERSATHLLDLGGKRLRPMCVALTSRLGDGFGPAARQLAVAAELVHAATLLHDDVVDVGDVRRGAPAARTVYGNAASIFAGDWLLVDALRRVRRARLPDVLDRLLAVIEEMILAEALQLEGRGRPRVGRRTYFRVVEGKTAALFRWAAYAGGRAGRLSVEDCERLSAYGLHLGVAFQLVDDLLDYAGEASATGKALFADLREGKTTYPLILALERDAALRALLEHHFHELSELPSAVTERLHAACAAPDVVVPCRDLAQHHAERAIAALDALPAGPARDALATVALATVHRNT